MKLTPDSFFPYGKRWGGKRLREIPANLLLIDADQPWTGTISAARQQVLNYVEDNRKTIEADALIAFAESKGKRGRKRRR